ncbi:hypothetical protein BS50DRAFT_181199 [Corynespora cassiicola Philippines]|uniref:Uncharacterized protein n=1 Tax=Corynespora cassiicola Philippines TaxID=1448308 RepID=A0A2T2P692_CORCC|nr:hypothetical protein BS50DRAFT_181199 [Corynespora cassiicola Philippines]
MSAPPSLDDLERQAPNRRTLGVWRLFGLGRKSVRGGEAHVPTQAGQCCFLCLQGKNFAQHAVRIPCFRSAKTHRDGLLGRKKKTRSGDEITKSDSESDFSVYQKLVEACYQYQGKWKRWVPFYGPVDVREVKFVFTGIAEMNGRFAIHIHPIIVDEVQEEENQTIAFVSKYDNDHDRCSRNNHNDDCEAATNAYHLPCMMTRYKNAWQRKKGLASLHQLRDCVRDPRDADEFRTLDGLAQRSFILENK